MTKLESGAPNAKKMKTCETCNAGHTNSVKRVLRCMLCVAKPGGNSNWRGHNAKVSGVPPRGTEQER